MKKKINWDSKQNISKINVNSRIIKYIGSNVQATRVVPLSLLSVPYWQQDNCKLGPCIGKTPQ